MNPANLPRIRSQVSRPKRTGRQLAAGTPLGTGIQYGIRGGERLSLEEAVA